MNKPIFEGAEAKIFLEGDKVRKVRIEKKYRHSELDEKIRRQRTKREGKVLFKAKEFGVNVPVVLNVDKKGLPLSKFELEIEYILGDKLSEKLGSYEEEKQFSVMKKIGEQVAKMHENNIIHGDLTTSNMIFSYEKIFVIDFGLGFISTKIEDKAVDLHLIKQALEAKHWQNWSELFDNFLKGYNWVDSDKVIERLKVVEKRGRYKH